MIFEPVFLEQSSTRDYATEAVERVNVASILQTVCSDFSDVGCTVSYIGPRKLIADRFQSHVLSPIFATMRSNLQRLLR